MKKPAISRPLFLFYVLVGYVLLQFSWWAYLLITTNNRVTELQYENLNYQVTTDPAISSTQELLTQKAYLDKELHKRWMMIVGEGAVFLLLLSWVIDRTRSGFKREAMLAERQKNFLLSVTHELRSPLASIGLQAETLMKRELTKEKQTQILGNILDDTGRLNALIGNILLAARIDNHSFSLQKTKRNLSDFVIALTEKIAAGVGQHHQFSTHVEQNIEVVFDELAAHSVIANLLENAIKYSPAGSAISVDLRQSQNKFLLSVADNGRGIPDAEKKTVFERFYRTGNEETRSTKGTGLGLYIANYLAAMHGWKIRISDNQPAGTVFTIEIPIEQ